MKSKCQYSKEVQKKQIKKDLRVFTITDQKEVITIPKRFESYEIEPFSGTDIRSDENGDVERRLHNTTNKGE